MQRRPGALIPQLIEKERAYGHLIALDCGQRRHIYHLNSRTIYQLIGDEEGQAHRGCMGKQTMGQSAKGGEATGGPGALLCPTRLWLLRAEQDWKFESGNGHHGT